MNQRLYLIFAYIFGFLASKAQIPPQIVPDSLIGQHIQILHKTRDSLLYNPDRFIMGKLYYPRGTKDNHPFYVDNYWKQGGVYHEGEYYTIPMMKYDLQNDVVVILKMVGNMGYPIQLDNKVILRFIIEGHRFVYIADAEKPGYYEELYSSVTKVWAKWTIWEKIDPNSDLKVPRFVQEMYFIIHTNNEYHSVRNLKELYDVFSDQKAELIKFKRANNLSFISDKSGTVRKLAEEYDNLKPVNAN